MEGIIFDVDGTLWDSTEEVARSWNQAISECTTLNRILTSEQLKKEFGKPLDEIVDNLFPELSPAQQAELTVHLYQYENRWIETAPCHIYKNVPETIQRLSTRYQLFIVSNCQSGYIEAFLKNTGLSEYITDFTCNGDTGKLKGENIQFIMERNSLKSAVYVGDTQGDADACKIADVPMVYAAYGFGNVQDPWLTIHKFDELLQIDFDSHIANQISSDYNK